MTTKEMLQIINNNTKINTQDFHNRVLCMNILDILHHF